MDNHPWLTEFYPIDAQSAVESLTSVGLVEHSLRKWTGFLPENMEKHGVYPGAHGHMRDKEKDEIFLEIDGDSCSLCVAYNHVDFHCRRCPIYAARGGVRCDEEKEGEE